MQVLHRLENGQLVHKVAEGELEEVQKWMADHEKHNKMAGEKKSKVELPENLIKKLQELPETGMGYQVVNLKFIDGKILRDIMILNCSTAILDEDIDVSQIAEIELSKELEEIQKPYATVNAAPKALRTAGLNLSQMNYWARIYDGAKASGSKFAGAIAWTQFKKKYRKVGNKWVLRKVQKDLAFLDQLIEKLEKVFQDFEVEVVKAGEEPSDLYEEGDELSKTLGDELSKALVERLQILYRLENGQLAAVLDSEDAPLEESEELEKFEKEFIPILKVDGKKHVVYGVVLEPEVWDAQKDIASIEEIEKAAHEFLAFYRKIDLRHHYLTEKAFPVESYLAPHDMELGGEKVKKGSWILGTKVTDKKIWKDIEDGVLTGFSIVGYAQRILEE